MPRNAFVLLLLAACLTAAGCGGGRVPREFRPAEPVTRWSDDVWAGVLADVATEHGFVDWDKLRENDDGVRDRLFAYVGLLGEASPRNRPELFETDHDVIAYYVNAYNALCMYGVVRRGYPGNVLRPGFVDPGALFFLDRFMVGGRRTNLDRLEQGLLDRVGRDPRLHFAYNCMSFSCPPLPAVPFRGDVLLEQLDEQGRYYLSDPRAAVAGDDGTVLLNEIFTNFYRGDFTQGVEGSGDGQLIAGVSRFAADGSPVLGATRVRGLGYKWDLNSPPDVWPPAE